MGLFKKKEKLFTCDNCGKENIKEKQKNDVCQDCLDTCRKIPKPLPGDVLTSQEVEKEIESNSVTENEEIKSEEKI